MLCKLQSNDHKQKLGLKIEGCLLSVSYLIWPTHSNSIIQYAIILMIRALIFINKRSKQHTSASTDQRDWMKTMKKKVRSMWNRCYHQLSNRNLRNGYDNESALSACLGLLWFVKTAHCWYDLRTETSAQQWLTARMKTRTLQFVR